MVDTLGPYSLEDRTKLLPCNVFAHFGKDLLPVEARFVDPLVPSLF